MRTDPKAVVMARLANSYLVICLYVYTVCSETIIMTNDSLLCCVICPRRKREKEEKILCCVICV